MPLTRRLAMACFVAGACLAPRPAQAQIIVPSCTASATPIVVAAAIDPVLGGDGASTGSITVQCSGTLTLLGLAACVKISPSPGSGRMLTNGAQSLSYAIFQDAAMTIPWGDTNATGRGVNLTSLVGVNGSRTLTAYLRVTNAATATPGAYAATAGVVVSYSQVTALLGCNSLGLGSTTTTSFAITADVRSRCIVSAEPLAFGPVGLLTAARIATADIIARCTNTTPYAIALDNGLNSAGTSVRSMKKGAETIRYALYRNPARTLTWGAAAGVDTVSGVGAGVEQRFSVYGSVPTQPTPSAGTYTDRVVVTVSY